MTKVERDALTWVNKIRRYEGRKPLLRLPKGDVQETYSCPLARALNHGKVGVSDWLEVSARNKKKVAAFKKARLRVGTGAGKDGIIYFHLPPSFARFITWFDYQQSSDAEKLVR